MGVYFAFVFISAEIYSFVYDVEPSSHCVDEYLQEMSKSEKVISLNEWMDNQDIKRDAALDWLADEFDCALNPWYNEKD